jgi:DNA-binding NarL/FixJ family response regulator
VVFVGVKGSVEPDVWPVKMTSRKQVSSQLIKQTLKRVFIVEDHPVFREGLVQVINREHDLEVCGHAGSAEAAFKEITRLRPDIVLVDISLPGKNGLTLIKELRAFNRQIKLLVVSMHDEALYANRVLRAGGDGYIMKQEDPEEVVDAIRDVLAGHIYVSEEVLMGNEKPARKPPVKSIARPLDELTDQQLEILECLGMGKDKAQIARILKCTVRAAAAELKRIQTKLKLKTDNELIRYAVCWVEGGKT